MKSTYSGMFTYSPLRTSKINRARGTIYVSTLGWSYFKLRVQLAGYPCPRQHT